jgi:hypothetical protein
MADAGGTGEDAPVVEAGPALAPRSTLQGATMGRLVGIWGRPFIDMESVIDARALPAIDDELTRGLALVEPGQTGGSLKHMGVTAPWVEHDGYVDYGHVIERFDFSQWQDLVALADDPSAFDPARWRETRFGDETDHPLNARQIRWLTYRHGVYFPWKVCVHLLENDRWEDKHSGRDKDFTAFARARFPTTIAWLKELPFVEMGRVVIFGLLANDHAPAHRDSEPGRELSVAQSLSIDPRGTKRFYLTDPDHDEELEVDSRLYWFNDMDYHGVKADPFFRYSLRIDGVYHPAFLRDLERRLRR